MQNSAQPGQQFTFQDRHFSELCELVFEHTGIKLSDNKRELVSRRFTPRLKILGLSDFDDYLKLVRSGDKVELEEFSNAITTNLTSFFRENHHFDYLQDECLPAIRERNRVSKKIRIWSAGCSTGPEPYSIAMVLREVIPDLERWDARILATDLDTNCLQTASNGSYTKKVVDTVSPQRLHRWFTKIDTKDSEPLYEVKSELKSLIKFNPLNLLKPFPFAGNFDVIICRNVFIYFDKPTQGKIIKQFSQHQAPGDSLIVGHSENLTAITDDYELSGQTIYRRLG